MDNHFDRDDKDEFFDAPAAPVSAVPPQKRRGFAVAAVLAALLIAAVGFLAGWFGHYYSLDKEVRTYLWAKSVAERNYYQPVDEAELYERLYSTLDLDPYSGLFTPEDYQSYIDEGAGKNRGVGVAFLSGRSDRIALVYENSPACVAGIRRGMYILGFGTDENDLTAGTRAQMNAFISAQKGEFILRCGYAEDGSDAENYVVKRESYQAAFCHYRDSETSFRFRGEGAGRFVETNEPLSGLDAETAYIRLDEFSGNAAAEFETCLSKMKERGRKHLVLDLRTNGGGYLDVMADIAACLIRNAEGKNPVIACANYRSGKQVRYACVGNFFRNYFEEDSRVYVLADEYTASASECLIGAMIDYGTVGYSSVYLRENEQGVAKTYGKGIMQSHFENANGAALKLTVAYVTWPVSGTCIHGVGITKEDGAKAVSSDIVRGERDVMLEAALKDVCG